jgi:ankyrin repeat protein
MRDIKKLQHVARESSFTRYAVVERTIRAEIMLRFILVLLVAVGLASPARAMLDALLSAAMRGDVATIAELLDAGAPIDGYGDGYSALMFAARYGQAEAAKLLLARGADTAHRDHNGDRAMLWAAREGHANVIGLLLAAGDPANSPIDRYGQSPLHRAALWGHADAVRVLLAAGADTLSGDQTEETPLHAATIYGFPEVVGMLLAAGGDPNAVEEIFRRTPVHHAAEDDNAESLRLLIDAGGDAMKPDRDRRTPLHLAAAVGRAATSALLIERGVDPDARDKDGLSALALTTRARALKERRDDFVAVANLLAGAVSDLDSAFAESVWADFDAAARLLATRGATATGKDHAGRSALAGAAVNGDLLELALARGANVHRDGGEALAAAARAGREDNARRLLGLGVPVDARTPGGWTPLMFAAMEARVAAAALLIERGADRNPVDAAGNTIEMLMEARRALVQNEIDRAGMSAALIPTSHLEEELTRLETGHAAILALLGR